jgi:hypothetical protein
MGSFFLGTINIQREIFVNSHENFAFSLFNFFGLKNIHVRKIRKTHIRK